MLIKMKTIEAVRNHMKLLGFADDAPKLSDLMKLFLEENVKDKSLVDVTPSDSLLVGHDDTDVMELKLNGILIAWVLNTEAIVRLRMLTMLGTTERGDRRCDIPAADPELFEKLWTHIALLDEAIDCPYWSILERHPSGKTIMEAKENGNSTFIFPLRTTESVYPAFNDDKN